MTEYMILKVEREKYVQGMKMRVERWWYESKCSHAYERSRYMSEPISPNKVTCPNTSNPGPGLQ